MIQQEIWEYRTINQSDMKPETAYKLVKMVNYIHLLKKKKKNWKFMK